MSRLTRELREALDDAAAQEVGTGGDQESYDKLVLALRRLPDDAPLPDVDLSDVEDELALDDASYVVLAVDYYGLDDLMEWPAVVSIVVQTADDQDEAWWSVVHRPTRAAAMTAAEEVVGLLRERGFYPERLEDSKGSRRPDEETTT